LEARLPRFTMAQGRRIRGAKIDVGGAMEEQLQDPVEEQLRDLISANLKVDKSVIQRGSKLADWGGDSLLFLETIFEVESHFNIQFPDTGTDNVTDFDSLVTLVKAQIAKTPASRRFNASA
jgi:acyl carrier protein